MANDTINAVWRSIVSFFSSKTIGTLIPVAIGVAVAFTLLVLLAHASNRFGSKKEAKLKDTVYVKLVDSLSASSFILATKQNTGTTNPVSPRNGNDTENTSTTFSDTTPRPVLLKANPVADFDESLISSLNKTEIPVWKWLVLPSFLLMLGTGIFLNYKRLPLPNYKLNIDKDPEELTRLFGRHTVKIEELGNPRKIKRFSNKLRFQYHYLKNGGLIKNETDLDTILLALLRIEHNLKKMSLDDLSEAEKKDIVKWFQNFLTEETHGTISDDLAKQLLQLNKNVIA